jgi:hypothetical protein
VVIGTPAAPSPRAGWWREPAQAEGNEHRT